MVTYRLQGPYLYIPYLGFGLRVYYLGFGSLYIPYLGLGFRWIIRTYEKRLWLPASRQELVGSAAQAALRLSRLTWQAIRRVVFGFRALVSLKNRV